MSTGAVGADDSDLRRAQALRLLELLDAQREAGMRPGMRVLATVVWLRILQTVSLLDLPRDDFPVAARVLRCLEYLPRHQRADWLEELLEAAALLARPLDERDAENLLGFWLES